VTRLVRDALDRNALVDDDSDLLSLDLVFLALRYQPGFRPLAVAYGAANIARVYPQGSAFSRDEVK
jgi:hypothetical protein